MEESVGKFMPEGIVTNGGDFGGEQLRENWQLYVTSSNKQNGGPAES